MPLLKTFISEITSGSERPLETLNQPMVENYVVVTGTVRVDDFQDGGEEDSTFDKNKI